MNIGELKAELKRHADTQEALAEAVNLSKTRLNAKINSVNGAEFTRDEIQIIKDRYDLSPERVDEIFFAHKVE